MYTGMIILSKNLTSFFSKKLSKQRKKSSVRVASFFSRFDNLYNAEFCLRDEGGGWGGGLMQI